MIPFLNFEEDFLTTEDLLFLAGASGVKGVEETATGNPVTFLTDLAKPLKSLKANFIPIQSGTGDPSPTNIRPITGWTGLDVMHGADQTDYDTYPVTWTTNGTIYGGYVDMVTGEVWATWTRGKISELIDSYQSNWGGRFRGNVADMTKSGNDVVKTGLACEVYNPSVQTSNDLIICRYMNNIYIKDTQYGNDVDAFKTAMGNYYVAYLLETPTLITTLSPQQITALKGNNTVWSDANSDCEVTYLKKG